MYDLTPIFESDNIIFTAPSELLADEYLTLVNDYEHVNRFTGGKHKSFTREQEIAWVRAKLEEKTPVFSMLEKKSGAFIGNIELMDPKEGEGELGIAITAAMQDRGYGTEAVRAFCSYCRETLGLTRIVLRTRPYNPRAIHVYEKCGFREYDRTDEHICMERTL